jgi:hypothetical protein
MGVGSLNIDSDSKLLIEEYFPEIASFSQKVEYFAFENHLRKIIFQLIEPVHRKYVAPFPFLMPYIS